MEQTDSDSADAQHLNHICAINSSQPLLKLPVEILGLILQAFLRPLELRRTEFKPHWYCSVSDCSALIPVSQTCRRLREVVQSLPSVAKSVLLVENQEHESREISKEMPLNMFVSLYSNIPPTLRNFYTTEVHRIQELHLTGLSHKALDLWTSLLLLPAPKLRFLSLTSPRGIAWLPPKGALIPLPPNALDLRYLTLNSVCFLPENRLPFLTHLALLDVHVPRVHSTLVKVLARLPNLESLVLDNIQESIQSNLSRRPVLNLPRLSRITMRHFDSNHVSFYLACLPRTPNQAFQLLDHTLDFTLNKTLIPSYVPNVHTLCFAYHVQTTEHGQRDDTYNNKNTVASITSLGPDGALHAVRPVSQPFSCVRDMVRNFLSDKATLTTVREVWLVGFCPSKAIPNDNPDDSRDNDRYRYLCFRTLDKDGHRISSAVHDVLTSLPALQTLVHVFRHTLEPNLWILPNAQNRAFTSRKFKTLKLIVCHGLPPHDGDSLRTADTLAPRPTLSLAKVREGLATEQYAYLDTLVLQIAAHLVVDDAELLEVSKYVPTVKIERIAAVPELALPAFCKEPAGSSSWLGALW